MNEQKLIDKVIRRGQLIINLQCLIILITTLGASLFLQRKLGYPEQYALLGLPLGILLSWLFWSFSLARWKVWAYSNVNDIQKLKHEAIKAKLIWQENSFLTHTAFYTKAQKSKLLELEHKTFRVPFPDVEQRNLPKTTTIKYPLINMIFSLLLPIFMGSVGINLILSDSNILGGLILFLSLLRLYKVCQKFIKRDHVIITLDDKGIAIGKDSFNWKDISEAEASFGTAGREDQELKVKTLNTALIINIGDYNLSADEINERIHIYRNKAHK
jgi:hypothetical protein